jgi:hypothetical protein
MLRNAQHMPAELLERAIPRAIVTSAPLVVSPIHLHDEPHLRTSEVDDALPDDELTTKRKPVFEPESLRQSHSSDRVAEKRIRRARSSRICARPGDTRARPNMRTSVRSARTRAERSPQRSFRAATKRTNPD